MPFLNILKGRDYFEYDFTARFARGAEYAEIIIFSFAVERTAKENRSAASLQKTKILRLLRY
jgi:hypothetical protein